MTPPVPSLLPRRLLPAVIAVAAVALGCTAPRRASRGPDVQHLADGSRIVCQLEAPTGSHVVEEVCRRVVPASFVRTELQEELLKPKGTRVEP
jgi:hypothetical protein